MVSRCWVSAPSRRRFSAALAAIVTQVISVIAVVLLIKLFQLQAVPRRLPAGIGLPPYPESVAGTAAQISGCNQPGNRTRQPGAVWRTAGEAAAGAPAAGWGADALGGLAADPYANPMGRGRRAAIADDPTSRSRGQAGSSTAQRWTGGAGPGLNGTFTLGFVPNIRKSLDFRY